MAGNHAKYQKLIDLCQKLPPTPTAVAYPCDDVSLEGATGAAKLGLISGIKSCSETSRKFPPRRCDRPFVSSH